MLVELLRAASREDEAREQLEKLAGEIEGAGPSGPTQRPPQERPAVPIGGRVTPAASARARGGPRLPRHRLRRARRPAARRPKSATTDGRSTSAPISLRRRSTIEPTADRVRASAVELTAELDLRGLRSRPPRCRPRARSSRTDLDVDRRLRADGAGRSLAIPTGDDAPLDGGRSRSDRSRDRASPSRLAEPGSATSDLGLIDADARRAGDLEVASRDGAAGGPAADPGRADAARRASSSWRAASSTIPDDPELHRRLADAAAGRAARRLAGARGAGAGARRATSAGEDWAGPRTSRTG